MKNKLTLLTIILLLLVPLFVWANQEVAVGIGVFHDDKRNRDVPYRVYSPVPLTETYPVIIFSHGLGGSATGTQYLGHHLAQNNFIAFHIQHAGSDVSVWKGKVKNFQAATGILAESVRNPDNARNRFEDIPFIMDKLSRLNQKDDHFSGHLNLSRIGMAGHSYGSISTMVASGQRVGRQSLSFKEPRIKAAVMLSPNLPNYFDEKTTYCDIDIPLFHITGTNDGSRLRPAMNPARRIKPYHIIANNIYQYLLVLDGADHMTFSGRRLGTTRETPNDKRHIQAVQTGVLLFFKGYLTNDSNAIRQLRNEFSATLNPADRFEWKN